MKISQKEHEKIIKEYDALIGQAWGEIKFEGQSVKHDPALARTLEWLKESYLTSYFRK